MRKEEKTLKISSPRHLNQETREKSRAIRILILFVRPPAARFWPVFQGLRAAGWRGRFILIFTMARRTTTARPLALSKFPVGSSARMIQSDL